VEDAAAEIDCRIVDPCLAVLPVVVPAVVASIASTWIGFLVKAFSKYSG
jgi:hypothetical protein